LAALEVEEPISVGGVVWFVVEASLWFWNSGVMDGAGVDGLVRSTKYGLERSRAGIAVP